MSHTYDLRRPDPDETALSPCEVLCGIREGTIPNGPAARAHAFVVSLDRQAEPGTNPVRIGLQPIQVFNFSEQHA